MPALPLAACTLPLYLIVPTYYTENLGLSLALVGQILLIIRLLDAVTDPLIGYLADQAPARYGRRRSVFLIAIPLLAVSAWMLFRPGDTATPFHLFFWSFLLSLGYTAVSLSYSAWGAELASGYQARTRVTAAREVAIVTGTLIATAMPAIAASVDPETANRTALAWLAIFLVILLPSSAFLVALCLPEPRNRSWSETTNSVRSTIVSMVRNKPFRRLLFAFFINGLANGLPATLFLFFVSERLLAEDLRGPFLLAYFAAGVISVPVWMRLATKTSKHTAWCTSMMLATTVFIFVPFIQPEFAWTFYIVCVLTGAAVGADLFLPASIQADVIDIDTAESGVQRSGSYFAAWAFATKLALGVAIGIAFPALAFFGFDAEAEIQTPQASWALALIYAWVPVVLKIPAIWLMWSFPLDRSRQEALQRKIEQSA